MNLPMRTNDLHNKQYIKVYKSQNFYIMFLPRKNNFHTFYWMLNSFSNTLCQYRGYPRTLMNMLFRSFLLSSYSIHSHFLDTIENAKPKRERMPYLE